MGFPGCCHCSVIKLCLTFCDPIYCRCQALLSSVSLGICSNSCPLTWWYYRNISSSTTLFLCLQSFPVSGSFPMYQLFASGGQNIGASAAVLPMNIQGWMPLQLTCLISLLFKGLSRIFSSTTIQKHQFFNIQPSLWSTSHIHIWLLEKNRDLTIQTFVSEVLSLLFNILSKFVIAFL